MSNYNTDKKKGTFLLKKNNTKLGFDPPKSYHWPELGLNSYTKDKDHKTNEGLWQCSNWRGITLLSTIHKRMIQFNCFIDIPHATNRLVLKQKRSCKYNI